MLQIKPDYCYISEQIKNVVRFIVVALVVISPLTLTAQTKKVDSLKALVHATATPTRKLDAILALSEEHQNINRDSFTIYATEALALSSNIDDKQKRGLALMAMANADFRYGWVDSAIALCDQAIVLNTITEDKSRAIYFKACRQKALFLGGKNKFPEALELLHSLVKEAEHYKDTVTMAANLNSIGSVTLFSASPQSAMQFIKEANTLLHNQKHFASVRAAIYVNMSETFFRTNQLDSALYYNIEGASLFEQEQNLYGHAMALQRRANIYREANELPKAEKALTEMIRLRSSTGDNNVFIDDNLALVNFYRQTSQFSKAIDYCKNALLKGNTYAEELGGGKIFMNRLSQRIPFLEIMADCYKEAGNQALYAITLEEIIAAKDSLNLWKQEEAIAAIQTQYEVQKKDNTIIRQQLDISTKNNLLIIITCSTALLCTGGFLLYYQYKKQQQLKAEKAVRDAEEKERERIAADLHDNLGAFAAAISSNLDVLKSNVGSFNSSTLQELDDNALSMVAQLNDTIWAMDKDSSTLIAISDRIKSHLSRLQKSYPNTNIEVIEKIKKDTAFSSVITFNLFRIIQEGVNNALRHSKADILTIQIVAQDTWQISITDNGIGISPNGRKGNGIKNQKNRAAKHNLSLIWTANVPSGTKLIIQPI